ncbi:uncharacterized protein BCR38DRAFT_239575 [Pseudomassariella vexata]|uniref:Gluconate kinase n=1 Tax=Pseudomassariella vexata TaxID=1141098 RepID=A0A1Y2DT44_9PEZI|nr:uncharacterized protein BCR38DRAFT_239575 [Pseudomassariella vexata]ORY62427.1 hypothetical protein BCR38DRAFT_239575 [Pseudomassariella vexata]
MQRMGLNLTSERPESLPVVVGIRNEGSICNALVTCYALRKSGRDGIRAALRANSVRVLFVVLQISKETLYGRTLAAEEPELAERIMREKVEDILEPMEEEKDLMVVDSLRDVDSLTRDIEGRIRRHVS